MSELDYIEFVKESGDIRMLLNPSMVYPLIRDKDLASFLIEHNTSHDYNIFHDKLSPNKIVIDIDHEGNLTFIYSSDRFLLDDVEDNFLDEYTIITSDPNYQYIRNSDISALINLRHEYN